MHQNQNKLMNYLNANACMFAPVCNWTKTVILCIIFPVLFPPY